MTIAELLKSKGIDEETVKSILDDMKANKLYIASEENLDIRYGKLKTDHDALTSKHKEAETLIEELQKKQTDNQSVQEEISEYKTKIDELNRKLEEEIADHALDVAVQASGVDEKYRKFVKAEIREKDGFSIDENGDIAGIKEKMAGLKTQYPALFANDSKLEVIETKLPDQGGNGNKQPEIKTLADALKAADEEKK